MRVSDVTLGVRNATLEEVATAIHERFGYAFVPRSSSYLGGDYYAAVNGREEVVVHPNLDGKGIAEEDYAEFSVLLRVNTCDDVDRCKLLLTELDGVLIRENQYDI